MILMLSFLFPFFLYKYGNLRGFKWCTQGNTAGKRKRNYMNLDPLTLNHVFFPIYLLLSIYYRLKEGKGDYVFFLKTCILLRFKSRIWYMIPKEILHPHVYMCACIHEHMEKEMRGGIKKKTKLIMIMYNELRNRNK